MNDGERSRGMERFISEHVVGGGGRRRRRKRRLILAERKLKLGMVSASVKSRRTKNLNRTTSFPPKRISTSQTRPAGAKITRPAYISQRDHAPGV